MQLGTCEKKQQLINVISVLWAQSSHLTLEEGWKIKKNKKEKIIWILSEKSIQDKEPGIMFYWNLLIYHFS